MCISLSWCKQVAIVVPHVDVVYVYLICTNTNYIIDLYFLALSLASFSVVCLENWKPLKFMFSSAPKNMEILEMI